MLFAKCGNQLEENHPFCGVSGEPKGKPSRKSSLRIALEAARAVAVVLVGFLALEHGGLSGATFSTPEFQGPGVDSADGSDSSSSSEFGSLSTPELARNLARREHELDAAYGDHRKFLVNGKTKERLSDKVYLFGKAIPAVMNFGAPGFHGDDACLIVLNPNQNGKFMGDFYVSETKYYLREGSGQNALGARVPCSIYGDLPDNVRDAVKKAAGRLIPVREEMEKRTAPETALADKLNGEVRDIQARLDAIDKEKAANVAALTGNRSEAGKMRERASAFSEKQTRLSEEAKSLYARKAELETQVAALKRRTKAIVAGEDVPSLEASTTQAKNEADTRKQAQNDSEAAHIQSQIDSERQQLARTRAELESSTRIHEGNMRDMARSGSNTSGEIRYFSEHKARLDGKIQKLEEKIAGLEQRRKALSGDVASRALEIPPSESSSVPIARESTGLQKANEAELLSIQRDIDRERQNIASMRKTMENDERIFEANLQDMNKSGSNPAGEIKSHNERKAQREKYIRDSEEEIALREARKAALTGGN